MLEKMVIAHYSQVFTRRRESSQGALSAISGPARRLRMSTEALGAGQFLKKITDQERVLRATEVAFCGYKK